MKQEVEKYKIRSRAQNLSSCSLKDNNGILKENEVINKKLPEFLETKVKINKCKNDISFSYDAGKFVCNNLYFHLLENFQDKTLFIHIPDCNNDENEYKKHAKTINQIITKLI